MTGSSIPAIASSERRLSRGFERGPAARRAWLTHGHRLVITDMQLRGDMNGLQLAQWLREQPRGRDVRLVGISADLDEADRALAAGIERMLQKPLSPASIIEALQRIQPSPTLTPSGRH